ncbi:MAG: hypothetical protein HY834_01230 [Devosia nanyangense]|uniref:Uncharacterized protein n=1 Tax=Devosia nanyangense TaxID=1228055 RepID=A0A933NWV1_9HYPH|nr:hypothetical protein [Devosia nanyangense]
MGKVRISDNSIWLKHIEADAPLRDRLTSLKAGDVVELEVAGIVGRWERMRDGSDGRPTEGIKPVEGMKRVWTQLQSERGRVVDVRQVQSADSYLAALGATLSEWDSPEDEAAYRDL